MGTDSYLGIEYNPSLLPREDAKFLIDRIKKRSICDEDFRRAASACVVNAQRVREGMESHVNEIPFLPAREKYYKKKKRRD